MRRTVVMIGALALPAALLVASGSPTTAAAGCTIVGTEGADVLRGTLASDQICGLGGDDRLVGLGGDDVLIGGAGEDMLIGRQGADRLFGGSGHDSLLPGAGDDAVDGGPERDNVSYRDLAGGVTVDLAAGTAAGSAAGTDSLTSITGMTGTTGDDTLVGTDGKEYVDGVGGDDVLVAGGGPDYVFGGAGTDTLDYSDLASGIRVALVVDKILDGDAQGTVVGVENLVGSAHRDHLEGDHGSNVISGGGGRDTLNGYGGDDRVLGGPDGDLIEAGSELSFDSGQDDFHGGAGVDSIRYDWLEGAIWADLDAGTVDKGPEGIDHVTSVEVLHGTFAGDHLYGGLGATNVTFHGAGGSDDINVQDGYGGDTISADSYGPPLTCVGDPGDTIYCVS